MSNSEHFSNRKGMMMPKRINLETRSWKVYTDGAIRPDKGLSGLAAIVRDDQDRICFWWKKRAGRLTNNEAEYAAVIFAIEQLLQRNLSQNIQVLAIYCDSRVVVDQMTGRAGANAPGLQKSQAHLRNLLTHFPNTTFQHIRREQNRLADALAFEAVEGCPKVSEVKVKPPRFEIWDQLASSWENK